MTKRYYSLFDYNNDKYGSRIYKATLDAGFSCPNEPKCIYCSQTPKCGLSIYEQWEKEKNRIYAKAPNAKICAYFGIRTNTFCSPSELEGLLKTAEELGAFSVSIATRADCIDEEKTEVLSNCTMPLTVELGLQTVHDQTAKLICRGHSFGDFLRGYELLKKRGIRVCVHIINGLPNEDIPMMLETARVIGKLRVDGVKIHSCHVMRGTRLAELYESGEYTPITFEEYIETVVRQLEVLPKETVIERLTGDGDKALLIAPDWSRDKIAVLGGIDKKIAQLDAFQGKNFCI
ncbi:MAG: TIGR01212 family radical SAM protein [Oscillospiraceae bacterium]|nr:TIGR01212 family radical SAM protein [Oscillospiraceae bacterium]